MPVKPIWILFSLLPVLALAESGNQYNEQPDLSLLEFLGSFEEQDNVWLDAVIDETQTAQAGTKQEVKRHEKN